MKVLKSYRYAKWWFVSALFALSAFACADLQLSLKPIFIGVPPSASYPLLVEAVNPGPDAKGELSISSPALSLHYPIDLPRGSHKSFIAYPALTLGEPLQILLRTDQGSVRQIYQDNADLGPQRRILTITDNEGETHFLHGFQANPSAKVGDYYVKPEISPDRSTAYDRFYAVILGEGAERVSDSVVASLKSYVLNGGTLLFIGGAAPVVARDPRWKGFLPVGPLQIQTVESAAMSLKNGSEWQGLSSPLKGPITLAVGQARDGAQVVARCGAANVGFTRPYGLGTVAYLAANPFDEPLQGGDGRVELLSRTLDLKSKQGINGLLEIVAGQSNQSGYGYGGYSSRSLGYGSSSSYGSSYTPAPLLAGNDPFNVKLPEMETIALILVVYLIVVAPLNLLILKKMKRGEWAWVTAPVISLIFAGFFFKFAASLYAASQSVKSNGVVIADSSGDRSYFIGNAQIFFPKGGDYDLKMKNAEEVSGSNGDPYTDSQMVHQIDATDSGQVEIPNFSATNLSFYQFSFRERVDRGRWLSADLKITDGHLKGTVSNFSPNAVKGCRVYANGNRFQVGDLEPGAHKTIYEAANNLDSNDPYEQPSAASIAALLPNRFLAVGQIDHLEVGPRLASSAFQSGATLIENLGALK